MEPPAPFPLNIPLLVGPRLIGIVLNWYLHGLLTIQYILYLMYSQSDRIALKCIVHFLFLLDSTQSILTMADTFFWFVYGFNDSAKLLQFHIASFDVTTFDGLIALVVQSMYCWRIWKLSQWRIIPAVTMLIALLGAVCGLVSGIRGFVDQGTEAVQDASHRMTIVIWLVASAVTDVIIATSMAYILLKTKRDSIDLQKSTLRKVIRILTLVVETNAITAAVAVETVAIFFIQSIAPPRSFLYEPGGYVLGKLYSNCFMVLLNQRHSYSTSGGTESTVEMGTMPDFAPVSGSASGERTSSVSNTTGADRHHILGDLTILKPRFVEGEESKASASLPDMQFTKADESDVGHATYPGS